VVTCPFCQKNHRNPDLVAVCQAKAERREALKEKQRVEAQRRQHNLEAKPVIRCIREMRADSKNWNQISTRIKQDYPKGTDYSLFSICKLYAQTLGWAPLVGTENAALMLLEKHAVGDFITLHPLSIGQSKAPSMEDIHTPELIGELDDLDFAD